MEETQITKINKEEFNSGAFALELKDARLDISGNEYYLVKAQIRGQLVELHFMYRIKGNYWQATQLQSTGFDIGYQEYRKIIERLEKMRAGMSEKVLDETPANV